MSITTLILLLLVIGILLYFLPLDAKIKQLIIILVVLGVVCWILNAFGVFKKLSSSPHSAIGNRQSQIL
jgi:hypothetical protein